MTQISITKEYGLKKPKNSKKPKKEELITQLRISLSSEQWCLLIQLTGREPKDTPKAKANYLSGLFHKNRCHSSRKAIGRNLQQWICKKIAEFTGLSYGKDEDIVSREGGQTGCDVRLSPQARKLFPYSIECKSGQSWDIPGAIKQAKTNLYPDTNWLVCLDRPHAKPESRVEPIIVISGELFFKILHRCGEIIDLDKD